MITNDNYKTLKELKTTNPKAYDAITETTNAHLKALAFASHEIKNMVSFMNSSYQLISRQHPETAEFRFWKEFGTNIDQLISFMDRTSMYRYCMTAKLEPVNLSDILYSLPDEADNRHPDHMRQFQFNIQSDIAQTATIMADKEHLLMALNEIIDNCYDATKENAVIAIEACVNSAHIDITISNSGNLPDIEYSEPGNSTPQNYECTDASILCKPFYTTKPKRSGLGLSIAYTVCTNHNGELWFSQTDNKSIVHIRLPLL